MEILSDPNLTAKLLDNVVERVEQQKLSENIKDLPSTFGPNAMGIPKNAKSVSLLSKQKFNTSRHVTNLRLNLDNAVKVNSKISRELNELKTSRKGRAISTIT